MGEEAPNLPVGDLAVLVVLVGIGLVPGVYVDSRGNFNLTFWAIALSLWMALFAMVLLIACYVREIKRRTPSWL